MSEDWAWLEEIEEKANKLFPEGIPICETEDHYHASEKLKLIACIKEMRTGLQRIGFNPAIWGEIRTAELIAPEQFAMEARETLNRCASGDFNSTAGRTPKEDV